MKLSELDGQLQDGTIQESEKPSVMKLSQLQSMESVDVTEDANDGGLVETTPEQVAEWQKRGQIGFMEQWAREDGTEKIPFWGGIEGAYKGFSTLNAVNRIKKGEYKDPNLQQEDYKKVNEFLLRSEEERIRGFSIGGNVTRGLANMPAFMIEFIATGGLASIGKMAVRKAVGSSVRTIAKNEVLSFATRLAGGAAGAVARTAGMPQRVLDGYTERQMTANVELTPKGLTIAKEVKEAPVTSFFKSWGDVAIENYSEAAGQYFGRYVAKPIKDILPGALVKSMEKVFSKIPKNKAVQNLWTKAGYNGFLGEMGEERLGDIMRAVTGVEDFGADDPHGMYDRLVHSIPNGTDLLTEALVISVPTGATTAWQAMANRYAKKQIPGVEITKATAKQLREITDAEAERIALMATDPALAKQQDEESQVELDKLTQQIFPEVTPESAVAPSEPTTPETALPPKEDTRGSGRIFHGTSQDVPQLIDESYTTLNYYGQGFYTTDAKDIAEGYSKKGKGKNPQVIELSQAQKDAPLYDMEAPITPELKNSLKEAFGDFSYVLDEAKNMREAYDALREEGTSEGLSADTIQEYFDSIRYNLENQGFRGLKHIGGLKTGKKAHEVKIYWSPSKDLSRMEQPSDKASAMQEDVATREQSLAGAEQTKQTMNRLKKEIKNLEKQRDTKDRNKEEQAVTQKLIDERKAQVESLQSEIKATTVEAREPITTTKLNVLRQRVNDILSGLQEGKREAIADAKAVQNELVDMLKQSDLDANDKAKFINTIKSIVTPEQFMKKALDIDASIKRLERKASLKDLRTQIKDALDSTKVRKQSGKPVGKFTPEIQTVLDSLRNASKMDVGEASDRLGDIMSDPTAMTPEENLEARILHLRINLESQDPVELAETLATIQDIMAGGKALNELLQVERKQAKEANVASAVAELSGGQGLTPGAQTFGVNDKDANRNAIKSLKGIFINGVIGWNNLMDWLSYKSGKRPGQSFMSKFFDVFKETRAAQKLKGEMARKMADMYRESYGLKDDAEVVKKMREDTKPVFLGRVTNAKGESGDLVMTKQQARKRIMELLDPSLAETFSSVDGMAYTKQMVEMLHKFMTVNDRKFIRAQLDFYQEYYGRINEVYKKMYGVNLPTNEFYSPIRRRGYVADKNNLGEFMDEVKMRRSVNARSLKSRVKTVLPLENTSDVVELEKHISEMGHFIVWAEKVRDMLDVFNDPRFAQAVKENYGSSEYGLMNNFLQDFARHGIDNAKRMAFWDQWRVRTTQTALALRPVMFIKQLASTPAYLSSMSVKEFTFGVWDFFSNPKTMMDKVAILKEHPFFKYRADNIDRDLKSAMQTDAYKNWRKNPSFVNRLMLNVELGDQAAIAIGGWAVYKKALKDGKTHEQALEEFARVSNETQQSGDLSEQSMFQRAGSLAKLFTMFMTSPNQYLRKEVMALRNLHAGRISAKEAAKTIAIYHFLLPMLFQWVSDFGQFKPKEQLRAALMGSLNGLFVVGDLLEAVLSKWLGIQGFTRSAAELPISKIMVDTYKALTSIDPTDIDEESVWNAIDGLAGVAGFATKMPIQQAKDMVADAYEYLENSEFWKAGGSAMGWSKYSMRSDE